MCAALAKRPIRDRCVALCECGVQGAVQLEELSLGVRRGADGEFFSGLRGRALLVVIGGEFGGLKSWVA